MKILLINPKSTTGKARWLPLGLAYIAAVLRDTGFTVKVMDGDTTGMQDFQPDVIGISAMTTQIDEAFRIAKEAKKYLPLATIVFGGVHPTSLPVEIITSSYVDIVVVGEGEDTMRELCIALDTKDSLENIKGIYYKSDKQVFTVTHPRELIENLDYLPFPAREMFNFPQGYTPGYYRRLPCATILTSRGCPGQCTFCNKNTFGNKFRARSAQNVINEIKYLINNYKIKEVHISDDNFTTDRQRAMKICDGVMDLDVTWACSNGIRVDFVDQELLNKMKQSGCYRVAFGIESGSPKILKNINKNITLGKIESAVKMAKQAGLITVGFFMVGNYGETHQTINETIKFIRKIDLDYTQFTIATPYPDTQLFYQVSEYGTILAKQWSDFNTYTGSVFEWNNLSKKEIDAFQKKMYSACYLNPKYILKRLINLKPCDLHFVFDGVKILKNVIGLKDSNR